MIQQQPRHRHRFRRVFAFAVVAHVLDMVTTHFRDPRLEGEGNPVYLLLQSHGLTGWVWLIIIKAAITAALTAGYLFYTRNRRRFVPSMPVRSIRTLIWLGMWDRKPYPKSILRRLFNRRKFEFGLLMLAGMALPASAIAALYIAVDNVFVGLGHPLPYVSFDVFFPLATVGIFIWWQYAYWRYHQEVLHDEGLLPETSNLQDGAPLPVE